MASAEYVLGLVTMGAGKPAEAEQHDARALALAEKLRGPRHVFVARYASGVADALHAQGQHARALEMYRRAQEIYAQAGDEVQAAHAESRVGACQLALGQRAEGCGRSRGRWACKR